MVSANFLGFAGDKDIEVITQGTNVTALSASLISLACVQAHHHQSCCESMQRTLPDPNPKLRFWIQEACAATINKYGVGSCGPRGFYGTIDVHLHLEEHLAKFMQTQETIIYAYDLATVPSILPAFANAKDIIICDEVSDYTTPHE